MTTNHFFEKKGPFPLKEIIKNIDCANDLSKENDFKIYGVESLDKASKNDMTFLNSSRYKDLSLKTKAAVCITSPTFQNFFLKNALKLM